MTEVLRRMGQPALVCMAGGEAGTRLKSIAGKWCEEKTKMHHERALLEGACHFIYGEASNKATFSALLPPNIGLEIVLEFFNCLTLVGGFGAMGVSKERGCESQLVCWPRINQA